MLRRRNLYSHRLLILTEKPPRPSEDASFSLSDTNVRFYVSPLNYKLCQFPLSNIEWILQTETAWFEAVASKAKTGPIEPFAETGRSPSGQTEAVTSATRAAIFSTY